MAPTLTPKWNSTYKKHGGISIMNLKRTWESLLLAACAIFAFENPADDHVISSRMPSAATGATPIPGCLTPRTFTNQIQTAYQEPRLLVVTDPRADRQPLTETPMLACLPTSV
ncbi:hypothetical protein Celaphus_00010197 [Cervus elaphus hippelaphus]|uniref:40S ribosomal protein SA n=1 Tax=Cervus elaphus hippelaphus TaxID=46360 RepID=A0A212C9A1_CEREH|nr:hypothetical protein Celaphus_00010197 [Cervus elaphus hippelaphus]